MNLDGTTVEIIKFILEFLIVPVLLQNRHQSIKIAVMEERIKNLSATVEGLINRRHHVQSKG